MPTTGRGLRYPLGTDQPTVPADLQELAEDVDGLERSGTLAARPLAGDVKALTRYYATDNGHTYQSVGGAWVDLGGTDVVRTNDARLSDQRVPTDGSVSTAKVGNGQITEPKLGDGAASARVIADGAVGLAELAAEVLNRLSPIGSVQDYAGSGDPAGGAWLLCDGRAVSRATYAALFTAIGTTYGAGDGSTTFNLPDFRGRVAVGPDNMGTAAGDAARLAGPDARGQVGGAENVALTEAQLPAHTHGDGTLAAAAHTHSDGTLAVASHDHSDGTLGTSSAGSHNHGGGTGGSGAGVILGATNNLLFANYSQDRFANAGYSAADGLYHPGDHSHGISTDGAHSHDVVGVTGAAAPDVTGATGSAGADVTGATGSTGGGGAHPNMQPYLVANKIIRAA